MSTGEEAGICIAFITEMERIQWIREQMGLPTSYDLYALRILIADGGWPEFLL